MTARKQPSYESLVKQGRQAAKSQWTLGDLASKVEIAYGEGKLQEYAEDIGVDYRTLLDYRTVARAYEKSERSELPWSVHRVLASQDDRAALVTDSTLTYRGAQALARGRKEQSTEPGIPPLEEETWLSRAVSLMRPLVAERTGIELPAHIRASIGWPSKSSRLGEAWPKSAASDGVPQIFISPAVGDSERVLDILAHELVHVGLPATVKHGKPFKSAANKLGLEGDVTSTFAGPILKVVLRDMAEELGPYPHAPITPPTKVKTKTRETEPNTAKYACVDCNEDSTPFVVTGNRSYLAAYGWPQLFCPIDGKAMEIIDE